MQLCNSTAQIGYSSDAITERHSYRWTFDRNAFDLVLSQEIKDSGIIQQHNTALPFNQQTIATLSHKR